MNSAGSCQMWVNSITGNRPMNIPPLVSVIRQGAPIGILGFCPPHRNRRKQDASMIFVCSAAFEVHAQTAAHMHRMNHSYLDLRPLSHWPLEPHAGIKMVQVQGSPVYICVKLSTYLWHLQLVPPQFSALLLQVPLP